MTMSLASSVSVFFISLMHSVNGAQFLIIIFFLLFGFAAVPVFGAAYFQLQLYTIITDLILKLKFQI